MKQFITAILFLVSTTVYAQGPDLGIQFNYDESQRITLEYRKPVSEKWNLNFGISYGSSNEIPTDGTITEVSDTSVKERMLWSRDQYAGLRIGGEKQLGTSMFSVGGDLLLTYKNSYWSYHEKITQKDSDGNWIPSYQASPPNSQSTIQVTHHSIVPALNVSIEMNVPLTDALLLNIYLGAQGGVSLFLDETNKNDPNQILFEPADFYFDLRMNAGIGLRYSFGQ